MIQVALPLAQIAHSPLAPPEARELARVLSRILQGERDPLELAQDLNPELAEMVWEALEQIAAPLPELDQTVREGLSFEQLIEKVAEACAGDLLLWQRLWGLTEELTMAKQLPPEIQSLGLVLRKILAGERQRHILDELSPEHRWAVAKLLDWLNQQAIKPGEMNGDE
jgi:hypothetical protein